MPQRRGIEQRTVVLSLTGGGPMDGERVTVAALLDRFVFYRARGRYHVYATDLPFTGQDEMVARYVGYEPEMI